MKVNVKSGEDAVKVIKEDGQYSSSADSVNISTENVKSITYKKDDYPIIYTCEETTLTLTDRGSYEVTITDNSKTKEIINLELLDKPKLYSTPLIRDGASTTREDVYITDLKGELKLATINGNSLIDDKNNLKVEDVSADEVDGIDKAYKFSGNGKYTVKLTDIYGYTEIYNFTIDTTLLPINTFSVRNPNLTKGNAGLNILIPEELATQTQREFSTNGGATWENWTGFSVTKENCLAMSRYVVKADNTVNYNNREYPAGTYSEVVALEVTNIDKTLPEITITNRNGNIIEEETSNLASIKVYALDENGIGKFEYTKDSGEPTNVDIEELPITLTERGEYKFTATDNAKNENIKTITLN